MTVESLSSVLAQLLPEPHAGLLAGLLFGTKAALSTGLYSALVTSGTIHIVALSGMNITIIMDIVAKTLLPIVGKRIAGMIMLFGIVWFVWFVGPSSTIVRAAIMGSISLLSVLFGRQYWAILSWIIAVGVMLLVNFLWLFEISFQLSAMATLGIILFGRKEKNIIMENLRLTLSAQVFTIPIIMFYFHRISLIAPISNLVIGWLIAPLTIMGWVTAVLGALWLPLGQIIAWFDWALLQYMIGVVTLMSRIPFASISL